ncbi:MAG: filamentous hemagglutinin N-terminal domain-containing protein [Mastigocoleus sp. MO_167.B18]|uniref:two-partner secretion domain-containing protein n=1 Tax=Mastigocoleus sp. MO_188.B34 TaxID=3036635 RepID=UPI002608BE1C|nr:filamentous hemagglutinin N-terminal domain-containing protein [Mastigocoleus sp. MO_188.B34]MDJ0696017.1 filamentous hemagglutinin N-terminal domain-containing protein [Mastigocoleus sp. MO_188.B34]MDJ0772077.1 filamentous hemagglutinin N-terminal domain-containing protein [Mastigocoleus sp. MO_167.B18]
MLSKSWVFLCCQFWLYFLLNLIFVERVKAQIIPDTTLNSEISIVNSIDEFNERINGGALRGANLFHSFREFNVGEGKGVIFAHPDGINNIFSRVTGNNPSNIFGKLGVSGTANLFLINPNGIVFGENATLDVQGSFVATTADAIRFGEGKFFSAREPESIPLLTISVPLGLQFNKSSTNKNPGQIIVLGNGQGTRLTTELIDTLVGLRVARNQTLALVAREISLEGGTLKTDGGRIELGSVRNSGSVSVNAAKKGWSLGYEDVQNFGDIKLSQQSTVDASGAGGGNIEVNARSLTLSDGSGIDVSTLRANSGGRLSVNASELIELTGTSQDGQIQSGLFAIVYSGNQSTRGSDIFINTKGLIVRDGAQIQVVNQPLSQGSSGDLQVNAFDYINLLGESELFSSGLFTQSQGLGTGGKLNIITNNLFVRGGAQVSASALSQGLGGSLTVTSENIDISGTSAAGSQFPSGLFVQTQGKGNGGELQIFSKQLTVRDGGRISVDSSLENAGNAGILKIETEKLVIRDGAQVTAGTLGSGQGGDLSVRASESVRLSGANSFLTTQSLGDGNGGKLTIHTKKLILENSSQVSTGTFGQGQGGNLTLTAIDLIELSGFQTGLFSQTRGIGTAGNMNIRTEKLIIQDKGQISASTSDIGNGGDINLNSKSLILKNDAGINSNSLGEGNAGDIIISLNQTLSANKGNINTSAQNSTGGGISINAKSIILRNNSDIRTDISTGMGGGGNIDLTADTIVALDDSDILSFARDGQGGDITFNTSGFFSSSQFRPVSASINLNQLNGNNRVDVNASGAISGNITGIPDTTFIQNSLNELPENQIDTGALIANSCIVRAEDSGSTFLITGSGGFPHSPGNADISNYSTGKVRSISNHQKSPPWKKGDPIVEPQGVFRLPNGKLLLSQKCN